MRRALAGQVAVGAALVCLASACGSSQSTAAIPTPASNSKAAAAFTPAGGPVPAQLLGDWFLPPAAVNVVALCRTPLTTQTCNLKLTLGATSYGFAGTAPAGPGDVVVDNGEIDFFNAPQCELTGQQGLGRYTWTLTGAALHFTPLNNDPCGRSEYLSNQSFYRAL